MMFQEGEHKTCVVPWGWTYAKGKESPPHSAPLGDMACSFRWWSGLCFPASGHLEPPGSQGTLMPMHVFLWETQMSGVCFIKGQSLRLSKRFVVQPKRICRHSFFRPHWLIPKSVKKDPIKDFIARKEFRFSQANLSLSGMEIKTQRG